MPPVRRATPFLVALVALLLAAVPGTGQLRLAASPPSTIPDDKDVVLTDYFRQMLVRDGLDLDVIRRTRFQWEVAPGGYYLVTFDVPEGEEVSVVGVCDDPCTDLDMSVLDREDNLVGRDDGDDSFPVVQFVADRGTRYVVRVDMTACAAEACYFGVGALSVDEAVAAGSAPAPTVAPPPPLQPSEASPRRREGAGIVVQPSVAQSADMERLLTGYIERAGENNMREAGYRPTGARHLAALDEGDVTEVWVEVGGQGDFAILGVCDNECEDLDFVLMDASGNEIDEDTMPDDLPLVVFSNVAATRYRLRVTMVTCTVGPCGFAFEVFQGG